VTGKAEYLNSCSQLALIKGVSLERASPGDNPFEGTPLGVHVRDDQVRSAGLKAFSALGESRPGLLKGRPNEGRLKEILFAMRLRIEEVRGERWVRRTNLTNHQLTLRLRRYRPA
jgi:hypothetical protein